MWVRKEGRVGRSGRFGLVWFRKALNSTPSVSKKVSDEGGYRAARAAKKCQEQERKNSNRRRKIGSRS